MSLQETQNLGVLIYNWSRLNTDSTSSNQTRRPRILTPTSRKIHVPPFRGTLTSAYVCHREIDDVLYVHPSPQLQYPASNPTIPGAQSPINQTPIRSRPTRGVPDPILKCRDRGKVAKRNGRPVRDHDGQKSDRAPKVLGACSRRSMTASR